MLFIIFDVNKLHILNSNAYKKIHILFLLLIFIFRLKNLKAQSYDDLKKKYENLEENDERALSTVKGTNPKAKKKRIMKN